MIDKPSYPTTKAPTSPGTLVKPGELIDIVEMTPLTLADRRIYNLLIANAWEHIAEDVEHSVRKMDLRGSHNVNDRVGESIERLMGALVRVSIIRDGKPTVRRVQLLGPSDENRAGDGLLYYRFPTELREIIRDSSVFARLRKDVMFALSSKYALALYEMVQKRGNLSHKWSEDFTVEELRGLLGVPRGRLLRFADLHRRALQPAVDEVSALSDYEVRLEPLPVGRKVGRVRLSWWRKSVEELKVAWAELQRPRLGRRARITGIAETITDG